MNFARLDLRFSDALSPIFYLVPSSNYDMSGKEGRLVIRSEQGVEIFNETGGPAGVTVVDHLLTDYLQYEDGSTVAPGNTVAAYRIAPELAGIVNADPAHKKTKRYRYGFTSDPGGDEWAVEGFWDIEPDTGPITRYSSRGNYSVRVGGDVLASIFFPGTQGPQGLPGAGGLNAYRLITESDSILTTDGTIEIQAGGSDISVAFPDPVEYFAANGVSHGNLYRTSGDTGNVEVTGIGAEIFRNVLFQGDSIVFQSNGINFLFR